MVSQLPSLSACHRLNEEGSLLEELHRSPFMCVKEQRLGQQDDLGRNSSIKADSHTRSEDPTCQKEN